MRIVGAGLSQRYIGARLLATKWRPLRVDHIYIVVQEAGERNLDPAPPIRQVRTASSCRGSDETAGSPKLRREALARPCFTNRELVKKA